MQPLSLINALKQVPDFRTQPRYPLWVILLLVILGTVSGAIGYRPLAAFVLHHQADLLNVPHSCLPSDTIRPVLMRVDFEQLTASVQWLGTSHFCHCRD